MSQEIIKEITTQDYTKITETIEEFLLEQIEKNRSEGVVLGLSGGIDSAVLAYICKKKLRDKTLALIMPDTSITPKTETDDALKIITDTGIKHKIIDIESVIREYATRLDADEKAIGNLRARVRTDILYYYANTKNYLVLGSSDKSEHMIGYFTKYGDGASDITPIVSLYKLQIREIAKHLGIPKEIILKKSSPHLWTEHEAENELGMQYEEIDVILYCLFERKLSVTETHQATKIDISKIEKIRQMHTSSEHKRSQPQKPSRD